VSPEDGGHETGGLVDMLFLRDNAAWISIGDDRDGKTVFLITNRKPGRLNPKVRSFESPRDLFYFLYLIERRFKWNGKKYRLIRFGRKKRRDKK
jgi:hypothetical protein